MTKLFALYDTLDQSGKAVKAVAAADFDGLEMSVIEEMPSERPGPGAPSRMAPVPSSLYSSGAAAVLAATGADADLFGGADLTGNQKAFLARGVQQGGALVRVDAPHELVTEVADILKESGGRVLPDVDED